MMGLIVSTLLTALPLLAFSCFGKMGPLLFLLFGLPFCVCCGSAVTGCLIKPYISTAKRDAFLYCPGFLITIYAVVAGLIAPAEIRPLKVAYLLLLIAASYGGCLLGISIRGTRGRSGAEG